MDFKYKIADVAKEFGVPTKKVIETVAPITGESYKTGSTFGEKELNLLLETLTRENAEGSLDAYLASGVKEEPAPAPKAPVENKKPAAEAKKPEQKPAPKAEEKKPEAKNAEEKKPESREQNPRLSGLFAVSPSTRSPRWGRRRWPPARHRGFPLPYRAHKPCRRRSARTRQAQYWCTGRSRCRHHRLHKRSQRSASFSGEV